MDYVEINKHTGERQVMGEEECRRRIREVYEWRGAAAASAINAARVMKALAEGKEWETEHQWVRRQG